MRVISAAAHTAMLGIVASALYYTVTYRPQEATFAIPMAKGACELSNVGAIAYDQARNSIVICDGLVWRALIYE